MKKGLVPILVMLMGVLTFGCSEQQLDKIASSANFKVKGKSLLNHR